MVAGATAWGLSALLPSWGYGYGDSYSNPYYVESAMPAYDYAQPIAVNTYDTPSADASGDSTADQQAAAAAPAAESPQTTEAYRRFDQALAAFKKGDYANALQLDQQAIQKSPQDPVMHEHGLDHNERAVRRRRGLHHTTASARGALQERATRRCRSLCLGLPLPCDR